MARPRLGPKPDGVSLRKQLDALALRVERLEGLADVGTDGCVTLEEAVADIDQRRSAETSAAGRQSPRLRLARPRIALGGPAKVIDLFEALKRSLARRAAGGSA